jgi:hypothetical protein
MPVAEWNCGCKVRYDLRSFEYERRCDQHKAMDELTRMAQEDGLYDPCTCGETEIWGPCPLHHGPESH